jgi:hypothetical protein
MGTNLEETPILFPENQLSNTYRQKLTTTIFVRTNLMETPIPTVENQLNNTCRNKPITEIFVGTNLLDSILLKLSKIKNHHFTSILHLQKYVIFSFSVFVVLSTTLSTCS